VCLPTVGDDATAAMTEAPLTTHMGGNAVSAYDDKYGSIVQEFVRGKSDLVGIPPQLEEFPRFEYAALGVRHKKGGLLGRGGSASSDDLMLDLLLGAGWQIVSVETQSDFAQFHLQRRHEFNCPCADCKDWKQFKSRLQPPQPFKDSTRPAWMSRE
jgi:hypothetical protein